MNINITSIYNYWH